MEAQELIDRFYEEVAKESFPDLTREQVADMCRYPFVFVRKKMQEELLPEIRIKYFGVFRVRYKHALAKLTETQWSYNRGKISHESYSNYTRVLLDFIERYEKRRPHKVDKTRKGG